MGLFGANNTGTSSTGIKSETIGILKKKKNGLELKASSSWTDDEQDNNTTAQKNNKKVSSKTKFWRLHDDLAVENKTGDTSSSSPFQFRNEKVDSAGKTKKSQTKTKKGEKFQRLEGVGSGTASPAGATHSLHTLPNNVPSLGFRANHLKRPGSSAKKNKPSRPLHTLPAVDEHKPSESSTRAKPIKIPSLRMRKIQQADSADSGAASFAEYQPPEFDFGDFGVCQDVVAPQQTEPERPTRRATTTVNRRETQKFQSFLNDPLQPCFSEDTAEAAEPPSDEKGDVAEIRPSESGSITHISEISGLYSESGFPTSQGGHNFQQIVFDKSFHEIKKVEVTQSDVGASDFSDFSAAAAKLTKELSKVGQKSKSSSCPKKKATETTPQRAHWPRLGEKKRDTPAYNRNTTTVEKHHTPMRRTESAGQLSREECSVSRSLNPENDVQGNVEFGPHESRQASSKAQSIQATSKQKSRNENEPPISFPFAPPHQEPPVEAQATKSFRSTPKDTFSVFDGDESWNATKNEASNRQKESRNMNDHFEFAGDSSWHTALSKPADSSQRGHTDKGKHGSVASRSIAFEAASRSVAFDGDGSWHKSRSLDEGGFSVISDLSGTQKGPFDQFPNERRDGSQKRTTQSIPQDFREIQNSLFEPATKPPTFHQSPPPVNKAAEACPFISGSSTPLDDMFRSSERKQQAKIKTNLNQFNQESTWDAGFDPFFHDAASRSAPKRSKNVTSTSSLDDGLIESIRSASAKKTRTGPEVGTTRKRDPSPKAVVMSSSDSALDQRRAGRANNNKYSPGPQRIPPKAIPTNAILGSMLFRQSQSSNDSSGNNESSDMNDVRDSAQETRDEVDAYGVPHSVIAARDDAESIVSSVTEEASSFYQKSFGGSSKNWNKSAHDLVSNYGVNRQSVREALTAAHAKANVTKGNLSRLEEEHVNVFLSEV